MASLKKLIKSKVVKETFYLHGADDEDAYFKALDVLKEEIKELEDKIHGKLCNCVYETLLNGTIIKVFECEDCKNGKLD